MKSTLSAILLVALICLWMPDKASEPTQAQQDAPAKTKQAKVQKPKEKCPFCGDEFNRLAYHYKELIQPKGEGVFVTCARAQNRAWKNLLVGGEGKFIPGAMPQGYCNSKVCKTDWHDHSGEDDDEEEEDDDSDG